MPLKKYLNVFRGNFAWLNHRQITRVEFIESDSKLTLPEHFVDLFNRSAKGHMCLLSMIWTRDAVQQYKKDANQVKHKTRRPLRGFQHQEEEHLKKMCDAFIIQPSNSEWASAPVSQLCADEMR